MQPNQQMQQQAPVVNGQVKAMAERLSVNPDEMHNIVINTVMPSGKQVSNEQFVSFMAVANEYKLNPLSKEIYAFPAKGGGIQPIVSIDGWLKIINTHPQFDGMEFDDKLDNQGNLQAITCRIYRKDRSRATEVTEYMAECRRGTDTWNKYPVRMLRHKATIQAARYAFGLSGIIDPDEADRHADAGAIESGQPETKQLTEYTETQFMENAQAWQQAIESGKRTPDQIIAMVESKYTLPESMKDSILNMGATEAEYTEEQA